ncbi:MAG: monovalent cation/H+ antiporter complex subunit F [Actinomycetota bacterium]
MTVVVVIAGVMLSVAAVLGLIRMIIGPTMLNRVMAMEILVAVVIGGLALEAASSRHTATLPVMLALAMVGFIGAVSVARYAERER